MTGAAFVSTCEFARNLARHARGEVGLSGMIDGRGVVAAIFDPRRRAAGGRDAGRDLVDAPFNEIAGRWLKRAHRAIEPGRLGNNVVGRAGVKLGDRNDASIERIDIARGDGLKRGHDLSAHDHRIDALMGHRRVAAPAFDDDRDLVGRGHERPRAQLEGADRQRRHVMHPIDFLDAERVHEPVVDHRLRARAAFLGGLKDHHRLAGEVAGFSQAPRRAEQHGGVPVMPAGVHFPRDPGAIGEVGFFLDRQRVHIGAEPDRARRGSPGAANDADHAGAADSRLDLVAAEGAKLVGDEFCGLLDIVKEPRVLMNFAPPGPGVGNEVGDV